MSHSHLWNDMPRQERERLMPYMIEAKVLQLRQVRSMIVEAHRAELKRLDDWIKNCERNPLQSWVQHDGGECPVSPDTMVELPAGTYHSESGVLGPFRAGDLKWRNDQHAHLRDEIQAYRIAD